jgi:hypothetical protein
MIRKERGAVPVIVIYAILLAMAFGGLAGLTTYLASDSVASFTLAAALALVVIFSIPILPDMLRGIHGTRRAVSKWYKSVLKEVK